VDFHDQDFWPAKLDKNISLCINRIVMFSSLRKSQQLYYYFWMKFSEKVLLQGVKIPIMELSSRSNVDLNFEPSTGSKGKYLVFDTETTGLLPKQSLEDADRNTFPRVLQVAWLLFDGEGKLIDSHNRFILQDQPIPDSSSQIHGIYDATVLQKGEKHAVVWNDFLTVLENCEYLIAHNIDFDLPVIESELSR
jgi:DNA polymerase III epsilon subunit-like protein